MPKGGRSGGSRSKAGHSKGHHRGSNFGHHGGSHFGHHGGSHFGHNNQHHYGHSRIGNFHRTRHRSYASRGFYSGPSNIDIISSTIAVPNI